MKAVVDYSGKSIPRFAAYVGFATPQTVREIIYGHTKNISIRVAELMRNAYPEISLLWLKTGKGGMLLPDVAPKTSEEMAEAECAVRKRGKARKPRTDEKLQIAHLQHEVDHLKSILEAREDYVKSLEKQVALLEKIVDFDKR